MGRWRPPRRGHHHILGGGIAHISPLCYTESEIPAALRATRHTAVFRTRFRREKEGERIRAAKRHIEPDTARYPAARISKPYPRKGTETYFILKCNRRTSHDFKTISPQGDGNTNLTAFISISKTHFKTISPQGDGNFLILLSQALEIKISKPYPRKGTETLQGTDIHPREVLFQNHIPARGRKLPVKKQ